MRLATGKRIGQSRQELIPATVFSFFLHILCFLLALFLYAHVPPRAFVPPAYRVNLVNLPADLVKQEQPAETPTVQEPVTKKQPKQTAKKKTSKGTTDAMPVLEKRKVKPEREYVAEDREPAPAKPADKLPATVVALSAPREIEFSPYVGIVREKIVRNWNPPPGAKETRATVVFQIGRTGRVLNANLQPPSGNFYFDQAAMRSILSSSPFPPFPEGYYQEALEFSVDLMAGE